jgi:hypothetical protein
MILPQVSGIREEVSVVAVFRLDPNPTIGTRVDCHSIAVDRSEKSIDEEQGSLLLLLMNVRVN